LGPGHEDDTTTCASTWPTSEKIEPTAAAPRFLKTESASVTVSWTPLSWSRELFFRRLLLKHPRERLARDFVFFGAAIFAISCAKRGSSATDPTSCPSKPRAPKPFAVSPKTGTLPQTAQRTKIQPRIKTAARRREATSFA